MCYVDCRINQTQKEHGFSSGENLSIFQFLGTCSRYTLGSKSMTTITSLPIPENKLNLLLIIEFPINYRLFPDTKVSKVRTKNIITLLCESSCSA